MIFWISTVYVVMFPFAFLVLLNLVVPLCPLKSVGKGLSILLILSKTHLLGLFLFLFLNLCIFFVCVCSPGSSGTCSLDQVGFSFRHLPASSSWIFGLKLCTNTTWGYLCFKVLFFAFYFLVSLLGWFWLSGYDEIFVWRSLVFIMFPFWGILS